MASNPSAQDATIGALLMDHRTITLKAQESSAREFMLSHRR